ncbi:MAG: uncharacterized protein A8A55_0086 [Amphiamblys sp. WSBS2006]|nr:MAG: uncharacterized protein A8A55_0086 [Amphiamblys sp. WSBS2006]
MYRKRMDVVLCFFIAGVCGGVYYPQRKEAETAGPFLAREGGIVQTSPVPASLGFPGRDPVRENRIRNFERELAKTGGTAEVRFARPAPGIYPAPQPGVASGHPGGMLGGLLQDLSLGGGWAPKIRIPSNEDPKQKRKLQCREIEEKVERKLRKRLARMSRKMRKRTKELVERREKESEGRKKIEDSLRFMKQKAGLEKRIKRLQLDKVRQDCAQARPIKDVRRPDRRAGPVKYKRIMGEIGRKLKRLERETRRGDACDKKQTKQGRRTKKEIQRLKRKISALKEKGPGKRNLQKLRGMKRKIFRLKKRLRREKKEAGKREKRERRLRLLVSQSQAECSREPRDHRLVGKEPRRDRGRSLKSRIKMKLRRRRRR